MLEPDEVINAESSGSGVLGAWDPAVCRVCHQRNRHGRDDGRSRKQPSATQDQVYISAENAVDVDINSREPCNAHACTYQLLKSGDDVPPWCRQGGG